MLMEPQTYSAGAVVNYFLDNAEKYGVVITPMKLQKMLYFANGWSWAFFDKPLISEECKAWKFGPVYPSVYQEYSDFSRWAIPYEQKMLEYDYDDAEYQQKKEQKESEGHRLIIFFPPQIINHIKEEDVATIDLLEGILKSYGKIGATTLSDWTHVNVNDNPWKVTRETTTEKSPVIKDELIKTYFNRVKQAGTLY
jgi:uncharacterized phage-associated protein